MTAEIRLQDGFVFDFTNTTRERIGERGLSEADIQGCPGLSQAFEAMDTMRRKGVIRGHDEPVLFSRLGYQEEDAPERIRRIEDWGRAVRESADAVVFLGIGGSWLGNQVLADALLSPLWNTIPGRRPRVFFSGNNVDPASVRSLEQTLDLAKTVFVVISKSGTTTETMAAFLRFHDLYRQKGLDPEGHFTAVTDPETGLLLDIARKGAWPLFEVPRGVGGRWSVLTDVGLLLVAAAGLDLHGLLQGARAMDQACATRDILANPAGLYAVICHLLHKKHGIDEAVLMPYCDALKSFSQWYVQLLAESLGKERNREGAVVNEGRTPIAAVGTSDMHAQTQQHREGKRNKLVTTVAVRSFGDGEIVLPTDHPLSQTLSFVAGKPFSTLLDAARKANEESLAADGRPSCSVSIPALDPYTLGELFLFFELATAFEGELLDVDAFDQPGVEHYKKYMKSILAGK